MQTLLSIGLRARLALLVAAVATLHVGCGDDGASGDDDDDFTPRDAGDGADGGRDGGPSCGSFAAAPDVFAGSSFALEGQRAWVLSLDTRGEDNFSCAIVEPDPDFVTLGIQAQKCNRRRCGVVLTVPDIRPNAFMGGGPLPTPEAGDAIDLTIASTNTDVSVPTRLSVLWLDEFDSSESAEIVPRAPVQVISGFRVLPGATFSVLDTAPLRILSMSGGTFAATIDVSTEDQSARAGGNPGGPPFTRGFGPGGGGANPESGGGGAGHAERGGGVLGGDAYGDVFASCAQDALDTGCGGSGGGGAQGPGGGGGGTVFLGALGPLNLANARFDAHGGDGLAAGGGGSGGNVMIAAPEWDAPEDIDVSGGQGGIDEMAGREGGDGAPGRVRIDVPGVDYEGAALGLTVEVSSTPGDFLVESADIVIRGEAQPGSVVCATDIVQVEDFDVPAIDAMVCARQFVGEGGTYEIPITLRPGLNRFLVQSGSFDGVVNSWNGNNVVFEAVDDQLFPIGATVDYVFVPDFE